MKQRKLKWIMVLFLSLGWAGNALAQPIFGPAKYERTSGTPEIQSSTFQACNTGAVYRLVVENGAAGKDRVSSATISLNGLEVIRPSDLNQRVEQVEKEVSLQGDNTLAVRLASNPGGFLTMSLFCASGCLDVAINSPAPGSTVNRARALVQGSLVNATGETGIVLTVAGAEGEAAELAQVQGSIFAGLVPLQQGENSITATATDACGYQVRKEVTVHADSIREAIRLSALPASGVLPAGATAFEVTLEAEGNLSSPAVHYAWDFDGDGTADQSGSDLTKTIARYQAPGLYLPTVIITDAQANIQKGTAVVLALSQEEMDTLLQGKWEDMRGALINGDIDAALRYFEGGQESKYKRALEKLRDRFSEIFSGNEELNYVSAFENRIEYENLVIEEDKAFSYPVIFILDENGLWKIRQF
jgi:hypothetical protein